ncbi:nucleolar protein 12-domain-containing protein [Russula compacta]|nr:nucleolar protein 12-domain-containing protein [Russula compacta]
MASNVQLLTQSHKAVKAKKRQRLGQINAIVFDEDARREFLTGFHKRKLAKKEEGKKKAQAREKEERLETRREQRRMLAEQAAQNAAKVEEAYGGLVQPIVESDEEWTGIVSPSGDGLGLGHEAAQEREYSDEEQLAIVTIVEDFDPSVLLHAGAVSSSREHPEQPPRGESSRGNLAEVGGGRARKRKDGLAKKVRYETKAARMAARATQLTRRTEKAERAGGKAARKRAGGKKKQERVK